MAEPKMTWEVLDRYFAGEATSADLQLVEQWLFDREEIRALLTDPPSDVHDLVTRRVTKEALARLERDMALPREPAPELRYHKLRLEANRDPVQVDARVLAWHEYGRSRILKAAAAITLVLGGSLVSWQVGRVAGERHAEAVLGTIAAPAGRAPMPVSLLDGSQVILSPGSTLRYATAFGVSHREVRLDGEAYFAVRHDARRPFLVRAGDLVVADLGTEFVVRAYPEDRHGRVIVREGRVGIGDTVVTPGQLGRLGSQGGAIVESADTAGWFGWTRGDLTIPHMPLQEALPKLNRWYGVQFRLAHPSLGGIDLAGHFPAQFGNVALDELGLALGQDLTREGQVVTVHANAPTNP